MAREEKKEAPAYIDYYGSDTSNSETTWNSTQFSEYWGQLQVKHHRLAPTPFNIAERTNLKRLMQQFKPEELRKMMEWYISTQRIERANNFMVFYAFRATVFERTVAKDYGWE